MFLPYILVGMSIRFLLFTNPAYVLLGSIMLGLLALFSPLGSIDAAFDYGVAISISASIVSALALLSRYISYAWLMVVGQASMAIYLSHTIVSALVRAVLTSIDIRNVPIHLVLGIVSGITLPLIVFLYGSSSERPLKVAGW